MSSGFDCYFYLSAAAGRDLLLGKKDSGTASTGRDLVDPESPGAGILEGEYIFQFDILLLDSKIMGEHVKIDFWLPIAVEREWQQQY
jgi:hypothetical protein